MRNDLKNLQCCRGCHQNFLLDGPRMIIKKKTGEQIPNEYCPTCRQEKKEQVAYIEDLHREEYNRQEDEKYKEYCEWYVNDCAKRDAERARQEEIRREPYYTSSREQTPSVSSGNIMFLFGPPFNLQPYLRGPQPQESWQNMYIIEGTATLTRRYYRINWEEVDGTEYVLTPANGTTPITFCISQKKRDKEPAFSWSAGAEGVVAW